MFGLECFSSWTPKSPISERKTHHLYVEHTSDDRGGHSKSGPIVSPAANQRTVRVPGQKVTLD